MAVRQVANLGGSTPEPRWERRPDDRPRALMAAALELLMESGYRRVRLKDIAGRAGVSKATVYHYFSNKDALLTRSIEGRMAERQRELEARLASVSGSASDRLCFFLHEFWRMSLTPQAGIWQRLLVSEIVTEAPDVFSAWARGLVKRYRLVESLIRDGQRAHEFREDLDAAVAARVILSSLAHQALFHVHFGMRRLAPCRTNRLFDAAMDQFLYGLRKS